MGNISISGITVTEPLYAQSINISSNNGAPAVTEFRDIVDSVASINLTSGSITRFSDNVTSSAVNADNAGIEILNNLYIAANLINNNSSIDLKNNQLICQGDSEFSNNSSIQFNYDVGSNTGGNILVQSGYSSNYTQLGELQITAFYSSSRRGFNKRVYFETKYII